MHPQKIAIPLLTTQVRQAAAVMARAFNDDPFFTFVIPNIIRRRRILPWLFERTIRYGQRNGKVFTTPSLDGVALWLGPEKPGLAWLGTLLTGLFLVPLELSWRELGKSMRLAELAEQLHKKAVKGQHWYMVSLGVEPSAQGQGVGGALLQPVLALADIQQLPCYLDTNNKNNILFYGRFGFTLAGYGQASQAGPHTWSMLRQPS